MLSTNRTCSLHITNIFTSAAIGKYLYKYVLKLFVFTRAKVQTIQKFTRRLFDIVRCRLQFANQHIYDLCGDLPALIIQSAIVHIHEALLSMSYAVLFPSAENVSNTRQSTSDIKDNNWPFDRVSLNISYGSSLFDALLKADWISFITICFYNF